ncbi:hypothetical protein [Salinibacter grassmerensis]|nr:hypothetical protein [Salinibacter grassmerensis]
MLRLLDDATGPSVADLLPDDALRDHMQEATGRRGSIQVENDRSGPGFTS